MPDIRVAINLLTRVCRNVPVRSLVQQKMSSTVDGKLKQIFSSGVRAVQGRSIFESTNFRVVQNDAREEQIKCTFSDIEFHVDISNGQQCHLVGFGKAVYGMAAAISQVLGDRLKSGLLSIPLGTVEKFHNIRLPNTIHIHEGAKDNLPDANAESAARRIVEFVERLTEKDVLFVLVSGGGSALLPLPADKVALSEKCDIIKQLAAKGADISDINRVRIDLSQTKGGKLAKSGKNAGAIVALIMSDIIGDPLHLIASGPTVAVQTDGITSKSVLEHYGLWAALPIHIQNAIQENAKCTPTESTNVRNVIIANNKTAIEAAQNEATHQNLDSIVLSTEIDGTVEQLSEAYTDLALLIKRFQHEQISAEQFRMDLLTLNKRLHSAATFLPKIVDFVQQARQNPNGFCVIGGGEPTVKITGNGVGGRNQELALRFSRRCFSDDLLHGVRLLSAGTDGIDGKRRKSQAHT